jgi:hypothetical protein
MKHYAATLCLVGFAIAGLSLAGIAQTFPSQDKAAAAEEQSTAQSLSDGSPRGPQASSEKVRKEAASKKDKWRVRVGGVMVTASYVHFTNGSYYPFFPYGFAYVPFAGYCPFFYDPLFWSAYAPCGPNVVYAPDKGKVELDVDQKDAEVYIDDAYAGTAGRLKQLWLEPGAYNLVVSAPDGSSFHQRIYVLSGKSVKIRGKLRRQGIQATAQER